jgi:tRNA (guanine37-N1)-methyltransferase
MRIGVVSIFPEMVRTVAEHGVVGRALERQLAALRIEDPRGYATDVHRSVDDRPYGGGPGMVLKYQPAAEAIRAARAALPDGCPVIYLSPSGRVFDQAAAARLAALPGMILLAGRYEGVDERLIEEEVDEELSLGDFVLSGSSTRSSGCCRASLATRIRRRRILL